MSRRCLHDAKKLRENMVLSYKRYRYNIHKESGKIKVISSLEKPQIIPCCDSIEFYLKALDDYYTSKGVIIVSGIKLKNSKFFVKGRPLNLYPEPKYKCFEQYIGGPFVCLRISHMTYGGQPSYGNIDYELKECPFCGAKVVDSPEIVDVNIKEKISLHTTTKKEVSYKLQEEERE